MVEISTCLVGRGAESCAPNRGMCVECGRLREGRVLVVR